LTQDHVAQACWFFVVVTQGLVVSEDTRSWAMSVTPLAT